MRISVILPVALAFAAGPGALQVQSLQGPNEARERVWRVSLDPAISDHGDAAVADSLAGVLAEIGSRAGVVVLRGPHVYPLATTLEVPPNIRLDFHPGAVIAIGVGTHLEVGGEIEGLSDERLFDVQGTVSLRKAPFLMPQWFGARGDGVQDDTAAIQAALDAAAQIFNQGAYPPAGTRYDPPVVLLKPGSYRVLDTLRLYTGVTLSGLTGTPYTNGHTRLIMDEPGNDKAIVRVTRIFQGHRRTHNATVTVQDLEFWFVTVGGSVLIPAAGPAYGNDAAGEPVHAGFGILFDEQANDCRVKRCSFFQAPDAAIGLLPDALEPSGNRRSVLIEECEFDTGNRLVRAQDVHLHLVVDNSRFYSGDDSILVRGSTGDLVVRDCDFDYNARVRVENSSLSTFHFTGNHHISSGDRGFIHLDKATAINISSNSFGFTTLSTIHVLGSDAGSISSNSIDMSGANTPFQTPSGSYGSDQVPAAIRLSGCRNVLVSSNSISTTDTGPVFGGFGIYSRDFLRLSQGNFVTGNKVSGEYNGASWRSHDRRINLAPGDRSFGNDNAGVIE